eukprot:7901348-Alexandrium_andersonii.AAC.1
MPAALAGPRRPTRPISSSAASSPQQSRRARMRSPAHRAPARRRSALPACSSGVPLFCPPASARPWSRRR